MRAGGSGCPRASVIPLTPRTGLERVARDLSRGGDLKQSLQASGYRAARWRALNVQGGGAGPKAAAVLAKQGHCPPLQDPGLSDVGAFQDARQLWIVMAAPFAPSVAMSAQAAAQRMLELVNRARASARSCGSKVFAAARPVSWNGVLAEAARLHAEDMARQNYFSHDGRDGSNPAQRVERAGYRFRATGENIAAGSQMDADAAVAGWIKSPGHCANLMNPMFTEMGSAFAVSGRSEYGIYWAQAFGSSR